MEQRKLSITRRTITIASLSAILITTIILAVVSFTIRRLPDDESIQHELSHSSYFVEELSKSVSVENNDREDSMTDASDVFAESTFTDDSESSQDNSEDDNEDEFTHGWIINEFGYTYVYDGCGYEQFNYKATAMERYVNSFDNLTAVIPEETRIFNITVPVSSTFAAIPRDIYKADNFYNQSQSAFVATVASKNNERIIDIPIVNMLEEQYDNGEYVFFRTDKNWTSLGAYTAYRAFCEYAEIDAYSIESFTKKDVGDFLGSFYNATKLDAMYASPDNMVCYSTLPTVKTSLTVYDEDIIYSDYSLCDNKVGLNNTYDVYFGRTAARYEVCTNIDANTLLIIGDSSAYPLVPYLASHYSKIDVIDPQKFNNSLSDFLKEHNYDDCITICYSTNAVSGEYVPLLNILTGVTIDE